MPSKSEAQKRTMKAAAHNPAFAKKVGIPQTVAREFYAADQRKGRRKAVETAFRKVKRKP